MFEDDGEYEVVPKTEEQVRKEEERRRQIESDHQLTDDLFSVKVTDSTPVKSSIVPQDNKVSLKQEKTAK